MKKLQSGVRTLRVQKTKLKLYFNVYHVVIIISTFIIPTSKKYLFFLILFVFFTHYAKGIKGTYLLFNMIFNFVNTTFDNCVSKVTLK